MPRWLALDWDNREARLVVASVQRGKVRIEEARAVPLPVGEGERSADELGAALGEARGGGRRRPGVLLGVPRAQFDLRFLTIDEPDEQLWPEVVRAEWQRELAPAQPEVQLDFLPRRADEGPRQPVTVATLPAEQLPFYQAVASAAGLRPRCLLAAPFAAAAWYLAWGRPVGESYLLIERAADEADLIVLRGRDLIFARTARLPPRDESDHPDEALIAEIKRTLVASSNQPGVEPVEVESLVICGGGPDDRALAHRLAAEFKQHIEVFDPFQGPELAPGLVKTLPVERGRWTATLGLILREADPKLPLVDFLNPRRTRRQFDRRQLTITGLAAAALVVGGGLAAYGWNSLARLDDQIAKLTAQHRELEKAVVRANDKQAAVAAIQEWTAGEIVWLDELRDLSARFPKRRDAVVERITLGRGPLGGVIELSGMVRDPAIVGRIENTLRDEHHEVRSKRVQERVQGKNFTWQFESSISVRPREREAYLASLPPGTAGRTAAPPAAGGSPEGTTPPGDVPGATPVLPDSESPADPPRPRGPQ